MLEMTDTTFDTVSDPLGLWQDAPTSWDKRTLWDLATYVNGAAFKPTDFSSKGLPVIKITELKYGITESTSYFDGEIDSKYAVKPGDLLFAWSGNPETSLDAFIWKGPEGLLNQHIFRVVPAVDVDKMWLFFLLKHMRPTFIRTARDKATSMGHVKVSDLKRLCAFVPKPDEQASIARILGLLHRLTQVNELMGQSCESLINSLFRSWFIDFEPLVNSECFEPSIQRLFPSQLTDTNDDNFPRIPDGWAIRTIKECCVKVENGGTPDRKIPEYWEPSVIPWLTSGEVKRRIIISTESSISQAGYENSSAKLWAPGTTVIALYGATAGQVCFLATETTANQACCGLIPLPSWESFVFAQASFLSTRFASLSRGSAQQNLSQGIVEFLGCARHPKSVQVGIVNR